MTPELLSEQGEHPERKDWIVEDPDSYGDWPDHWVAILRGPAAPTDGEVLMPVSDHHALLSEIAVRLDDAMDATTLGRAQGEVHEALKLIRSIRSKTSPDPHTEEH